MRQISSALGKRLDDPWMNGGCCKSRVSVGIGNVNRRPRVEQVKDRSESPLTARMNDGLWADHLIARKFLNPS